MSSKTYYSVTKFTNAVIKNDPKVDEIILPFVPERQKPDQYKQFYIEPIGIVLKYKHNNKPTILSYATMIKTYGFPIITFRESKYRKINFREELQIFRILTEEREYNPDKYNESVAVSDQTSFSYYPSRIIESVLLPKPVITKIQELKEEYMSKCGLATEFDEDANFI